MKKRLNIFITILVFSILVLSACKKEETNDELIFKIYDTSEDVTIEKRVMRTKDMTPQDIIDLYKETYIKEEKIDEEYQNYFPNIEVKIKDNDAVLDFDKVIENVGSGTEGKYIDNIVAALLDNVAEVNKVYITVKGEAYESGHILIETNEVVNMK